MSESQEGILSATYTSAELSKLLKCSLRHIRNLDSKRAIPGRLKIGRLIRFSKQRIDAWLSLGSTVSSHDVNGGAQ
jgi:excisionase family DNA binding protein